MVDLSLEIKALSTIEPNTVSIKLETGYMTVAHEKRVYLYTNTEKMLWANGDNAPITQAKKTKRIFGLYC